MTTAYVRESSGPQTHHVCVCEGMSHVSWTLQEARGRPDAVPAGGGLVISGASGAQAEARDPPGMSLTQGKQQG